MKKRILKTIICLSIFTCIVAQAQVYVPFPDSNAVWNVFADLGGGYNEIVTIHGDSLYNGHVYKKYYSSYDTNGITAPTLARLVRQDIPNKKIFAIYPGNSTEQLLYKFGLNVNDTVTIYTSNQGWGSIHLKVFAIDSFLINGQYRKRLELNSSNLNSANICRDIWIEGIGSMCGVFNAGLLVPNVTDIVPSKRLVCFTKNGIHEIYIIGSNASPRCFVRSSSGIGIGKQSIQQSLFKIYPNPTAGILNIELNATLEKPLSISIRDALGRTVKQLSLSASTKIDLSDVKEGIYFLQVWEDGRLVASEKLVRE